MLVRLVELAFTYTPFVVKVVTVIIRSVVHTEGLCNVTDHLMLPTDNRGSVRVELFNVINQIVDVVAAGTCVDLEAKFIRQRRQRLNGPLRQVIGVGK